MSTLSISFMNIFNISGPFNISTRTFVINLDLNYFGVVPSIFLAIPGIAS